MEEDIWNNYPQELLDQAALREAEAEQALLNRTPCDPDPYNISLPELIQRWVLRRIHHG